MQVKTLSTSRYNNTNTVFSTTKAIFGYGTTGTAVSITNLVSNTGVVATDGSDDAIIHDA